MCSLEIRVLPKALSIAREIAENTSAVSVTLSKALLWHGLAEGDPQSVHLIDSRCFFWAGKNEDAYEGVQSFLEKRPPRFPLSPTKDLPDFYPWWKEPKTLAKNFRIFLAEKKPRPFR